jgi:hypothetical protein
LEAGAGLFAGVLTAESGAGLAAGAFVTFHGVDVASSGFTLMWTGQESKTWAFRGGVQVTKWAGSNDDRLQAAVGVSFDIFASAGSAGSSLYLSVPSTLPPYLTAEGTASLPRYSNRPLYNWWYRGAEADAAWRASSLETKWYYELGQKTVPDSQFTSELEHMDAVSRGRTLGGLTQFQGYTNLGKTMGTGPTPAIRYVAPRSAIIGGTAAEGSGGAQMVLSPTPEYKAYKPQVLF